MSAADKARHYRLGHGGKRGIERKETTNDKTPRLTCDIWSVSFVTGEQAVIKPSSVRARLAVSQGQI